MEKPQSSRFGIPNVLWLAAILSLLVGGGYGFVSGSPTLAKAAESPESAVANTPAPPVVDRDEEEGGLELATFMGRLQIVTHKLNLSVLAENPELL